MTVNVGIPDEDDPLAPVPTVACTDTRFIPVKAEGIRKYALSDVVSAVVPLSEVATYFIPKLEPARPSGVNARVVSVPVFVSAIVASSTAPVTVSLALRYVFVALDMSLFVRVSVLLTVGTFTPSTAILPADTRVIVVSDACHTSRDHTPSASVVLSTTQASGSHVQLVRVPDVGVPSTGAIRACPLGNTTVPVKVGEARFALSARSVLSASVPFLSCRVYVLSAVLVFVKNPENVFATLRRANIQARNVLIPVEKVEVLVREGIVAPSTAITQALTLDIVVSVAAPSSIVVTCGLAE